MSGYGPPASPAAPSSSSSPLQQVEMFAYAGGGLGVLAFVWGFLDWFTAGNAGDGGFSEGGAGAAAVVGFGLAAGLLAAGRAFEKKTASYAPVALAATGLLLAIGIFAGKSSLASNGSVDAGIGLILALITAVLQTGVLGYAWVLGTGRMPKPKPAQQQGQFGPPQGQYPAQGQFGPPPDHYAQQDQYPQQDHYAQQDQYPQQGQYGAPQGPPPQAPSAPEQFPPPQGVPHGQYASPAPEPGQYSQPAPEPGQYSSPAPEPGQYSSPAPEPGQYSPSPEQGQYAAEPQTQQFSLPPRPPEQYSPSPEQGQYAAEPQTQQFSLPPRPPEQYSPPVPEPGQYPPPPPPEHYGQPAQPEQAADEDFVHGPADVSASEQTAFIRTRPPEEWQQPPSQPYSPPQDDPDPGSRPGG